MRALAMARPKPPVPMVHLGVRIPEDLLARIDAATARLAAPGVTLDRTQTVRALLTRALDDMDAQPKKIRHAPMK